MTLKMPADPRLWLSQRAHDLATAINPLFHGTRYLNAILESGMLVPPEVGDPEVSFSRSPNEAAFWATLPRDDDEGRGAVLVFDRDRLAMRHRLEPVDNAFFDVDEQEERVWERNVLLADGLVGIATQPQPFLGRGHREVRSVDKQKSATLGDVTDRIQTN
jgi:hypothetical protein